MSDLAGKTILILGCGYLGGFLARMATDAGMKVKAVSRNQASLDRVAALGADVCQDLVNDHGWHGFAGGEIDFVANCVSSAGNGLPGYRLSYVEGNHSLTRWAEQSGFAGTAVFTSSVSVYSNCGGSWVHEADSLPPDNERGAILVEAERIFFDGLPKARSFSLRLAGLYGPGRCLTLDAMRSAPALISGAGDYYLNLVRIEDAARAVLACFASASKGGVFSVVDNQPSLKRDIVAWLAQRLEVPMPEFQGWEEGASTGSRRLGSRGQPANRRIANAKAKLDLGWQPEFASFREGFEDLIQRG